MLWTQTQSRDRVCATNLDSVGPKPYLCLRSSSGTGQTSPEFRDDRKLCYLFYDLSVAYAHASRLLGHAIVAAVDYPSFWIHELVSERFTHIIECRSGLTRGVCLSDLERVCFGEFE